MDVARSCQFDKFAALQIGQGFAHVGGKRRKIDIVLFGQRTDKLT
jgi:hypothetical protein